MTVASELFRRMVAFEKATRASVLALISEHVWALLNEEERKSLFASLVREFLSKPARSYSQKAVVDALDSLHLPSGDLICFLVQTLGLGSDSTTQRGLTDSHAPAKPLVMVSSILVLTTRELARTDQAQLAEDESNGEWTFFRATEKLVAQAEKPKRSQKGSKAAQAGQESAAGNPKSGGNSTVEESDELLDELEPLQPQRSLSVPIAGPKGGVRQAHAQLAEQKPPVKSGAKASAAEHSLSNDDQLLSVFRLAVWICR